VSEDDGEAAGYAATMINISGIPVERAETHRNKILNGIRCRPTLVFSPYSCEGVNKCDSTPVQQ